MMTIDTMIYIILAISGIATVSLYLNIYCAIKLYNTLDQSDKLDKANDAVEGLHLENMKLIEQKDELQRKIEQENELNTYYAKRSIQRSIQQYAPEIDQSKIEKLLEMQRNKESRSKDNFKQAVYPKNIKTNNEK